MHTLYLMGYIIYSGQHEIYLADFSSQIDMIPSMITFVLAHFSPVKRVLKRGETATP